MFGFLRRKEKSSPPVQGSHQSENVPNDQNTQPQQQARPQTNQPTRIPVELIETKILQLNKRSGRNLEKSAGIVQAAWQACIDGGHNPNKHLDEFIKIAIGTKGHASGVLRTDILGRRPGYSNKLNQFMEPQVFHAGGSVAVYTVDTNALGRHTNEFGEERMITASSRSLAARKIRKFGFDPDSFDPSKFVNKEEHKQNKRYDGPI